MASSQQQQPRPVAMGDTLGRHLLELCQDRPRQSTDNSLRHFVEAEARDLSGESFNKFMTDLYTRIYNLINSNDPAEKLGGVRAIDELIDVKLIGEEATKISRFSTYLRDIFQPTCNPQTMSLASQTLGHLVKSGGALTADVVESEVKRALDWLKFSERVASRRYAAVLILKEMADNAPTVFNVHVPTFIDAIWPAIRDPKLVIRENAILALRACLCVVEKRETRYRVQWYYKLFEETQRGLGRTANMDSVHGSLLTIGELLQYTGEFMLARYREVAETVIHFRDHKERVIRRSVTVLIPRLAAFSPDRFAQSYVQPSITYLMGMMRSQSDKALGFSALGDLVRAIALGEPESVAALEPYLPTVASLVREAITPKRGRVFCSEALTCSGHLAMALKERWAIHAAELVQPMFNGGLCEELVEALSITAKSLPALLPPIQERLFDAISWVLANKPYRSALGSTYHHGLGHDHRPARMSIDGSSTPPPPSVAPGAEARKEGGPQLTRLALHTLASFDFMANNSMEVVCLWSVGYLEHDDADTRQQAVLTCCRLLEKHHRRDARHEGSSNMSSTTSQSSWHGRGGVGGDTIVERVLHKLMSVAIVDLHVGVRKAVFQSLHECTIFDPYLAQADALRSLFITLNDESWQVRELAIVLAGRLATRNPAYVLPALRRHLMQLLNDLQHSSDAKVKQDGSRLLGCLIRSAPRLILPYVSPILKTLVLRLKESQSAGGVVMGGGSGVITSLVLETVGSLSEVAGPVMQQHVGELLPLIIESLIDGSSTSEKRAVGVKTLGSLVASTGYVVMPYNDYPQLLEILLRLLNQNSWEIRHEVVRVLGIIGALDPHTHKCNQLNQAGENQLSHDGVRGVRAAGVGQDNGSASSYIDIVDMLPSQGMATSSEEFYPTVAINSLMKVLRDVALANHQLMVVRSLMYIFQALGLGCVPYMPRVMPALFVLMRTCEDSLREFMFQQFTKLVSIVRQHIRKYLEEIMLLVKEYWTTPTLLLQMLKLLEELCGALNDDFRKYLPDLLPRMMSVLAEAERKNEYSTVPYILHALEKFGRSIDDHLHMLLPSLVRIFSPGVSPAPLHVQRLTLQSLGRLLPRLQLVGIASSIVHPLARVVDGPHDELRRDALTTLCAVLPALGADAGVFGKMISRLVAKHDLPSTRFEQILTRSLKLEDAGGADADWEEDVHQMEAQQARAAASAAAAAAAAASEQRTVAQRLTVNEDTLKRSWESSQRSTKEDWAEWMRHFSVDLLRESPSHALRACCSLAQLQPHVARDLFPAGFVSCWSELHEGYQEQLVRSLEAAFASPTIPPEILATLLNLAEFMEHDEKPLPVDIRTLGALAEKCHAFAKALHYKEMEFLATPHTAVEALISINNQLRQPEAAVGMLTYAQQKLQMELKESWYEKLQRWEEALDAYERKAAASRPTSVQALEATLGKMRCLGALAEWEQLSVLASDLYRKSDLNVRRSLAPLAAQAAWQMGEWEEMEEYVTALENPYGGLQRHMSGFNRLRGGGVNNMARSLGRKTPAIAGGSTAAFYRAILCVHKREHGQAREFVNLSRELLGTELAALVGESYERAYAEMVRVQQLREVEEVIEYSLAGQGSDLMPAEEKRQLLRNIWRERLRGAQRNVEVWQALLSVRSLVVPMSQDLEAWLKFASLCRVQGRVKQAHSTLLKLLMYDPAIITHPAHPGYGAGSNNPPVMLAYLKHRWADGHYRADAFARLQSLVHELRTMPLPEEQAAMMAPPHPNGMVAAGLIPSSPAPPAIFQPARKPASLLAKAYLRLGLWRWALADGLDDVVIAEVLTSLRASTEASKGWAKAWHHWALFNAAAMEHYSRVNPPAAQRHVAPAVMGFFRSIALGAAQDSSRGKQANKEEKVFRGENLQDILRLLTLWFNHGAAPDVETALLEGFGHVSIDTWLVVIPQIIARIHSNSAPVRKLIHSLFVRIGRHHPQALIYPLLVACKSQSPSRRAAAMSVLDNLRQHSATLVEQAQLVSQELIRMAILWHEMWHEALEEASRLYFGECNVEGMLSTLLPLHQMMEKQGPETLKEIAFVQAYGRELQEAHEWCQKYRVSRKEAELQQAWDLYYHVFKRINKQLPSLTTLELKYVAPNLVRANNLELAVPGTYQAGQSVVVIASFAPSLHVITSKQRPRKLTIVGGDGADYVFLLKGHEDLRQDERVMQLFGLVNTLLLNDRTTAERDLAIARYAVIPLSPNSGLIGWVPNCDTFHALIREYRDARKVALNVEHRLMLAMAPDYDHLSLMQKVEVFEHALDNTAGTDLYKVLWLKSRSSEVWLNRRTNYTRSLAVMSMVGYLLGLGDRHPSNLMLDRYSGKILHIDFGDCFEASMNRDKFPEKVPFRLTRMLVKAMEVSGIEGNFRHTCEIVMRVLRSNKDSVMAMLEAFVHDPLINWRLLQTTDHVVHGDAVVKVEGEAGAAGPSGTAGAGAGAGAADAAAAGGAHAGGAEVPPGGGGSSTPGRTTPGGTPRTKSPGLERSPGGGALTPGAAAVAALAGGGAAAGAPGAGAHNMINMIQGDAAEALNERAITVMKRMSDKLTGRDFEGSSGGGKVENATIETQVQKLIEQATSHENLCQSYIGWCPFW